MNVLSNAMQIVSLHAEHDEILLADIGCLVESLHVGFPNGAVMPMELQPLASDRGEMRTPVDDRNSLAGQSKLDREEAADRAGADDTDFHLTPSLFAGVEARSNISPVTARPFLDACRGRPML